MSAISFAAIFFREAAPTPPLVSAGLRLLVAALLLLPFTIRAFRSGRLSGPLLRGALLGGVFYGVHFGSWVASLGMTTVAASVTLVTASPVLLALVGLATGKDRPSRRLWLSLGLAFVGVLTIGGHDLGSTSRALIGDGLALVGAAAMAGYLLIGRHLGAAMDVWAFSGVATAVGAALLLGAAAVTGTPPLPASWEAFGYLALAALLPQLVGHGLLTWSLRHTTPTAVGVATVGEPVGATLLAWLWLSETPGTVTLIGCSVAILGVVLAVWRRDPK